MAVGASTVEVLNRLQRLWLRWVAARIVARVADPWHAHFKQLRIAAAMGIMAIRAVLHHWRMLPKERPPALGVATQTVLVRRGLNQLRRIRAAVWIMATGTGHLAFAIRH